MYRKYEEPSQYLCDRLSGVFMRKIGLSVSSVGLLNRIEILSKD